MAASEQFVPRARTWRQVAHLRHKANVYNTLKKGRSTLPITSDLVGFACLYPSAPSRPKLQAMLFMVIERFKHNNPNPVGERFKSRGRMLPQSVTYQASWMETSGSKCFQLMEAPTAGVLNEWIDRWNDLVDFEIIPVVSSAEYSARTPNTSQ